MFHATHLLLDRRFGFHAGHGPGPGISGWPYTDPANSTCPGPSTATTNSPGAVFWRPRAAMISCTAWASTITFPATTAGGAAAGRSGFQERSASKSVSATCGGTERASATRSGCGRLLASMQAAQHPPHDAAERPSGCSLPGEVLQKKLAVDAAPRAARSTWPTPATWWPGRSGLNGLSGYWAAKALITAVNGTPADANSAKRCPKDLKAGDVAYGHLGLPAAVPRR